MWSLIVTFFKNLPIIEGFFKKLVAWYQSYEAEKAKGAEEAAAEKARDTKDTTDLDKSFGGGDSK